MDLECTPSRRNNMIRRQLNRLAEERGPAVQTEVVFVWVPAHDAVLLNELPDYFTSCPESELIAEDYDQSNATLFIPLARYLSLVRMRLWRIYRKTLYDSPTVAVADTKRPWASYVPGGASFPEGETGVNGTDPDTLSWWGRKEYKEVATGVVQLPGPGTVFKLLNGAAS